MRVFVAVVIPGILILSLAALSTPLGPVSAAPANQDDLQERAVALFGQRCATCHGPDSFAAAGMDYILEPEKLVSGGKIVPGDPDASMLYQRVSKGEMPADGSAPLPDADIQLIHDWIAAMEPAEVVAEGAAVESAGEAELEEAAESPVSSLDEGDLQGRMLALLNQRCAKCHGPESFAAGGMDYILDINKLIENGQIAPGRPDRSHLYEMVSEGKMPADGSAPLPDEDIALISDFIHSLPPAEGATATDEDETETGDKDVITRVINWLGNFHPVLVHFPIALVLIAAFFELMSLAGGVFPLLPMERGREAFALAARLCVFFGAAFAALAGLLGWFNAFDHFFAKNLQDELFWHRWLGTAFAALFVLTALLSEIGHRRAREGRGGGLRALYRLLLFAAALLVIVVGHLGGTLVFGEGYYNF